MDLSDDDLDLIDEIDQEFPSQYYDEEIPTESKGLCSKIFRHWYSPFWSLFYVGVFYALTVGFSADLFVFVSNSMWRDHIKGDAQQRSPEGFFPCWTGPLTSQSALADVDCDTSYLNLHHPVLGTLASLCVVVLLIIGFIAAHFKCANACQALPLKLSSRSRVAVVFVCFIGFLVAFIPLLTVFMGTEIPYGPCESFLDKAACQGHYSIGAAFTSCHTCEWVATDTSGSCIRALHALGPKADDFYHKFFPEMVAEFPSCATWPSVILPSVAVLFPTIVLVVFGFLTYRAPSVDEGYAPVESGVELPLNY